MAKIDDSYDMKQIHLFKKSSLKYILGDKTLPKLKKLIKENVNTPTKDIKVYLIKFKFSPDNEYPLRISVAPYIITDKLNLIMDYNNVALTIKYSTNELKKYGFNHNHINKIIKAIKNNKISYKNLTESITNILE
jgi:hypothetical protein